MIRKADIVLGIVIVIAGLIGSYMLVTGSNTGNTLVVIAEGKEYGNYKLAEDQIITVKQNGHVNEIVIENGKARMNSSDCHNQVCVHNGEISNTAQSIVCLPNKLIVKIEGEEDADYDIISG